VPSCKKCNWFKKGQSQNNCLQVQYKNGMGNRWGNYCSLFEDKESILTEQKRKSSIHKNCVWYKKAESPYAYYHEWCSCSSRQEKEGWLDCEKCRYLQISTDDKSKTATK